MRRECNSDASFSHLYVGLTHSPRSDVCWYSPLHHLNHRRPYFDACCSNFWPAFGGRWTYHRPKFFRRQRISWAVRQKCVLGLWGPAIMVKRIIHNALMSLTELVLNKLGFCKYDKKTHIRSFTVASLSDWCWTLYPRQSANPNANRQQNCAPASSSLAKSKATSENRIWLSNSSPSHI